MITEHELDPSILSAYETEAKTFVIFHWDTEIKTHVIEMYGNMLCMPSRTWGVQRKIFIGTRTQQGVNINIVYL